MINELFALLCFVIIIGIFTSKQAWCGKVAIACDICAGVMAGGEIGMTISSWCEIEHERSRWAAWLRARLNSIRENHCAFALKDDVERARIIVQRYG
jgi:hypothetical protein